MITDHEKYQRFLMRSTLKSRGLEKTGQLVNFYRKDLKKLYDEFKAALEGMGSPPLTGDIINQILELTDEM